MPAGVGVLPLNTQPHLSLITEASKKLRAGGSNPLANDFISRHTVIVIFYNDLYI